MLTLVLSFIPKPLHWEELTWDEINTLARKSGLPIDPGLEICSRGTDLVVIVIRDLETSSGGAVQQIRAFRLAVFVPILLVEGRSLKPPGVRDGCGFWLLL